MNYKEKSEVNPTRCRVLRQNERQIENDRRNINSALNSITSELGFLRDSRRQLGDKATKLRAMIAGATVVSGGRGAIGHVVGGGVSSLTTELAVLQSRIDALNNQIAIADRKSEDLKLQKNRLDASLTRNSAEMRSLHCVV